MYIYIKVQTVHEADSPFAFESARRTALTRACDGLLHCALLLLPYTNSTYTHTSIKVLVCVRLLLDASITTCAGCAGVTRLSLDL